MNLYKKFAIIFASFIFLGWFVCQPLNEVFRYQPYMKMSEEGHKISHKELDAFLAVWSEMFYSYWGRTFDGKSLKDNQKYPKGLEKYLRMQSWDIERFFYDEQRIRDMMEYVDIQQKLKDSKQIAKSGVRINLNDIISDMEKRLDTSSFDKKELELIEVNKYQIEEILTGRAILGKE